MPSENFYDIDFSEGIYYSAFLLWKKLKSDLSKVVLGYSTVIFKGFKTNWTGWS